MVVEGGGTGVGSLCARAAMALNFLPKPTVESGICAEDATGPRLC